MTANLPEIPPALLDLMANVGPRWRDDVPGHVRLMTEQFFDLLRHGPRDGISVRSALPYGPHERQVLDVFLPPEQAGLRPMVLFVHGGAFVSGHRNKSPEIYANVLYSLARNGVVGLNIGYRLAGDAKYPGATRDVASAVSWARTNAAELGVDPGRIFLFGHSAGAAHVGSYAYDRSQHPAAGPGLAGVIIVSGRVRADNGPENPNARKVEAYYGDDPTLYDSMSPVSHIGPDGVPTFVCWSEFENPLTDVYCAELLYRLAFAKRRAPPSLWLRGHNHTSAIAHLNTADDALEKATVAFIHDPR